MAIRKQQKEETRTRIINVALTLYGENGFVHTTTAEIARAANVSHGTIFVHFPTQKDIFISVINAFGSQIATRLHDLLAENASVRDVFAAHLKGLIEFEPFYSRLVSEQSLLPLEARDTLVMIQSCVSFHLGQAIERQFCAQDDRALPIHLIFNGWIALIHYYLANHDLFAPGESVLKNCGKELLAYYCQLITKSFSQANPC
ncbi:transcriptional regulator, TetR family [Syntrophobotulus glycolicus DSM 8271]|uniref:Transcriptional regulator, TetR family n=1 Tax=Syntrophobotulus glycolicus (strain DSM 8271 / FlGlyR) TaxID=645991 RepID=F0SWT8_SYNGF|nr:TetR/AcrR family transcriptional regulator [Syntrophobotulus glycolicus]ADY54628.1 transcriptional regulator, TetR family [Syntrophobotulus glycolicus DSM 8271]